MSVQNVLLDDIPHDLEVLLVQTVVLEVMEVGANYVQ
tara:strand:- start:510 stop:620 length:111 start_codon:yes stop_codon:yes gene_type:complete